MPRTQASSPAFAAATAASCPACHLPALHSLPPHPLSLPLHWTTLPASPSPAATVRSLQLRCRVCQVAQSRALMLPCWCLLQLQLLPLMHRVLARNATSSSSSSSSSRMATYALLQLSRATCALHGPAAPPARPQPPFTTAPLAAAGPASASRHSTPPLPSPCTTPPPCSSSAMTPLFLRATRVT